MNKASVNIRKLMKSSGTTVAELARRTGIQQPTVHRIVSGEVDNPRLDNIIKLAKALGVTTAELLEEDNINNITPAPEIKGYIPLISWVQAGAWSEAIDLYEPGYAEETHPTTVPHSLITFALRVEGDSMTVPTGTAGYSFPHNMIIYVDPEQRGGVSTGDFVIARLTGENKVTFKKLGSEEGTPILKALNPSPDYPIIRDQFEILGKVIDASWGGL